MGRRREVLLAVVALALIPSGEVAAIKLVDTDIMQAAKRGDLGRVKRILRWSPKFVNKQDENGRFPQGAWRYPVDARIVRRYVERPIWLRTWELHDLAYR